MRLILAFALLVSSIACSKYQRYPLPLDRLEKVDVDYLQYYLVDAAHPLTKVWRMSDCKIGPQEIDCRLTKLTANEAAEISLVRGNRDARASKNDVLFYADPRFALALQDTGTQKIHTGQLEKIEVFELNHLKTYGTPLLSITGFICLLFLLANG